MLEFRLFDAKVGKWLTSIDGAPVITTLSNTILENLFPNGQFSFASVDEATTAQDLQRNHPDGHRLLFSSGKRFVFGDADLQRQMETIFPNFINEADPTKNLYGIKDRGAYGALLIGDCNALSKNNSSETETKLTVLEKPLRILIVDDISGENGGYLNTELAKQLTGDCHGRMSIELAQDYNLLINKDQNLSDNMVQFRSVLRNFDIEPSGLGTHKIAKGTLLAQNLRSLEWNLASDELPDLIIAKSSFKGANKPPVGLFDQDVWLGAKAISDRGKMSISSLLPLYPGLLKDVQPRLEPKMAELAMSQDNPAQLAKIYLKANDDRKQLYEANDFGSQVDERPDSPELQFIRAAVESNNPAALQAPLAVKELQKFTKNQWKAMAIGQDKSIAFDRAMALPDKALKNGEISVPWLDDGEQVIVYRPPLINTNGVHILTNNLKTTLPYSKDAKYVAISDDDTGQQSVMSDMALDFDGDHLAIARANDYPNLAREVRLKQLETNRYPAVVKEKKQEFAADASQEEAALQMARSPVGLIANSLIAAQSEISAVETLLNRNNSWVKPEDRTKYAADIQQTIGEALSSVSTEKPFLVRRPNNLSKDGQLAFRETSSRISEIANRILKYSPEEAPSTLADYKLLLREVVTIASSQNQIAVDMPKSSRKADAVAITDTTKFLAHRNKLQQEKKMGDIYVNRPLTANGISPQEILAATTNQYWSESKLLQSLPTQFKGLFESVPFTPEIKAQANGFREKFQELWIAASNQRKKEQNETGPSIQLKTTEGQMLDVVNLAKGRSDFSYAPSSIDTITIIPVDSQDGQRKYHKFAVLDARRERIGDLCEISAKSLGINSPTNFSITDGELKSRQELSVIYFERARDIAAQFTNSVAPDERPAYAAALWAEETKESAKGSQDQSMSKAILYAFPIELANQLRSVDMNQVNIKLTTAIATSNTYDLKAVAVDSGTRIDTSIYLDNQQIGHVSQQGYPLLPGNIEGTITPGVAAMLRLEMPGIEHPLTVGKVNQYAWANQPIDTVEQEISILPTKLDSYRLEIGGRCISDALSREASEYLVAKGYNKEPFSATVKFIPPSPGRSEDKRSSLQLNFPDGGMVNAVVSDPSLRQLDGQVMAFSVANNPKYAAGVFIKTENELHQIGEFTAHTVGLGDALSAKASLELIVSQGLLVGSMKGSQVDRTQPLTGKINTRGTLSSDGTNKIFTINSYELPPPLFQSTVTPDKSSEVPIQDRLRAYNSQKSPVLLQGDVKSILSVDYRVGAATEKWLQKNGVDVNPESYDLISKGLRIISMNSDSISPQLLEKMSSQGAVFITSNPNVYQRSLDKIPTPDLSSDINIAGINISSNSLDPMGKRIAELLTANYTKDISIESVVQQTISKNPDLVKAIAANGGHKWLQKCSHYGNDELSGIGDESPLIRALSKAFEAKINQKASISPLSSVKLSSDTRKRPVSKSPSISL